jgi:hypothetical protein
MKMHKNMSSNPVRGETAPTTRATLVVNSLGTLAWNGAETNLLNVKRTASVMVVLGALLAGCCCRRRCPKQTYFGAACGPASARFSANASFQRAWIDASWRYRCSKP